MSRNVTVQESVIREKTVVLDALDLLDNEPDITVLVVEVGWTDENGRYRRKSVRIPTHDVNSLNADPWRKAGKKVPRYEP